VSRLLSARLGVAHIELDSLFWKPGWVESSADELVERVTAALDSSDGWVVDGNYRSRLGERVLDCAELVVWLDLPLRVSLGRLLSRTFSRIRSGEQLWGGNVETWRNAFVRRDALWWFAVKSHLRWRRRLPVLLERYPHVRLRSQADVDRFLTDVR
jgi:adenylate kinase family enzyme